jgi:hypothetical protein
MEMQLQTHGQGHVFPQRKVQKYSALAQRINADLLCDEGTAPRHTRARVLELGTENPLLDSKEEQELASEIENELRKVRTCVLRRRFVTA